MKPEQGTMPSWTDAANFRRRKLKCVIFGPGKIDDCHTERENISLDELDKFTKVIFTLLCFMDMG